MLAYSIGRDSPSCSQHLFFFYGRSLHFPHGFLFISPWVSCSLLFYFQSVYSTSTQASRDRMHWLPAREFTFLFAQSTNCSGRTINKNRVRTVLSGNHGMRDFFNIAQILLLNRKALWHPVFFSIVHSKMHRVQKNLFNSGNPGWKHGKN